MHVSKQMVNKQLKLRGTLSSFMFRSPSETNFRKMQTMLHKFYGKSQCKGVINKEIYIPRSSDGSQMRVRIYKPLHPIQDVPGVLWLHGGGYAIGAPEMDHPRYKRFIDESNCIIMAPDYRLSVEMPYPAALYDA